MSAANGVLPALYGCEAKVTDVTASDLRRASPLLAFQIASTGLVLFERSAGLFRQFQSLAARRYADTRKLREAQRRAIQVFLHHEGLT